MILSVCDLPEVMKVMRIVNIVITIIKVVVPIMLIVSAMIDLVRAVSDGELNKITKPMVNKIIAAILVFLIPTFVKLIANIAGNNGEYSGCLGDISIETINTAYVNREEELVSKSENTNDINDYNNALNYLNNIKDQDKKNDYNNRLAKVKEKIDESNQKKPSGTKTTGYGKDIKLSDEATKVCNYLFNADTQQVRLYRCICGKGYNCLYTSALPGGGNKITMPGMGRGDAPYETEIAKNTIPITRYLKGAFSVEQPGLIDDSITYEAAKVFELMFKGDFFGDYRFKINNKGEIQFPTGTCTQCYSDYRMINDYDNNSTRKSAIDSIVEETKYFILVNDDGELTNSEYAGYKPDGVTFVVEGWSRKGMKFVDMIKELRTTDVKYTGKYNYKTTNLYDCRNLITTLEEKTKKDKTIYLGDSRTEAYNYNKSGLGIDESKEVVIAKSSTGYDSTFKSHLESAKRELKSGDSYNVTVNYGVNSLSNSVGFCNDYVSFAREMDSKNDFYIVSVTPVNDNVSPYAKNSRIEEFNNYMKNTCINRIKQEANKNAYYCDVYSKISLNEWQKYVDSSGIHFTRDGYKFIIDSIRECTSSK